jgi:hypothetical protein
MTAFDVVMPSALRQLSSFLQLQQDWIVEAFGTCSWHLLLAPDP